MASSTEPGKVVCFLCNKAKGIYKCEGCSQIFCPKHSVVHRDELNKQLDDIIMTHDLVHQTINQQTEDPQTEDPQKHPLIQEINRWEENSIERIRKTAEKARNDVFQGATGHTNQVKQRLKILSDTLKQGREDNDFSEIDLRQWTQKLDELKNELLNPTTIRIQEDSTSFISNLSIVRQDSLNSDVFERFYSDAQIKEEGRLIMKLGSTGHTEIRGKNEYKIGRHKIHFRVEQLQKNPWIFFGIISKSEPMQNNSYQSSSAYGWSNVNQTYVAGQYTRDETLQITQNDILILSIDTDRRKIQLENPRLNQTKELTVDINKCPFPWQLHLNLYAPNTQIRILPSFD